MLFFVLLSSVFAATDPQIQGCWFGAVVNGKLEIVLSKNKNVSDALWFDDGSSRVLTDLTCSKKLPVTCTLEDDGGKFELRLAKKTQARLKVNGMFIRRVEEGESVAISSGREATVNLVKMPEAKCQEKTKELFKIFGIGP